MVANERSFLDQSSMHVRGSSFRELHDLPEITAQVRHLGGQALYRLSQPGAGRIARLEAEKERNGKDARQTHLRPSELVYQTNLRRPFHCRLTSVSRGNQKH